jgi:RecA-family ATPase
MVAQRKLKKQWANQITVRPIDWLWRPWLARGVVSVIDGYPGVGKSTLMFDLIARVTTGRPMPFENRQGDKETRRQGEETCNPPPVPGRVVLMPLEDPEDSVVAPRLKSAGVDMANVAILGDVVERGADGDDEGLLQLPRDLDLLAAECAETRPELLVIDPFFAVLGVDEKGRYIKANDDQSVRRLTSKLKKLAERFS